MRPDLSMHLSQMPGKLVRSKDLGDRDGQTMLQLHIDLLTDICSSCDKTL